MRIFVTVVTKPAGSGIKYRLYVNKADNPPKGAQKRPSW